MKKVIFIFLILISCLCFAVVSCADKEESSTDTTTTGSITDGSAEGYMRIGNMQIVWGKQNSDSAVTFPVAFSETPTNVHGSTCSGSFSLTTTSFDHACGSSSTTVNYLIIGKWK
jgi:hypothetical protein